MTPTHNRNLPAPDLAALWSSARRLHPIYAELAREFVIDLPGCADLENGVDSPDARIRASRLNSGCSDLDDRIQVHQLRQFLQTSSLVDPDGAGRHAATSSGEDGAHRLRARQN